MIYKRDVFIFETTKTARTAAAGIIGIHPDTLKLYEGYDDPFRCDRFPMSKEERAELADYMISLWTKFKEDI